MIRAFLTTVFVLVLACAAQAERRVALVFGMNGYKTLRPLSNAVQDAQTIDVTLQRLGFEVSLETNRDLRRMRRALEDFREDAAGADVAMVFYAGHGVEIAGDNRLLPVDTDASTLDALKASTLPLEEIRASVAAAGKVGLVVLDACRNDPFGTATAGGGRSAVALAKDVTEQVKTGLGRVGRAENVLFAFAAAPGQTATDGDGANSPFTAALAKYLGVDGLEVRSVLTLVQQDVYDLSRGAQLPYVESGLPKMFFASATPGTLSERERLLLAMADLKPALRDAVEQVAVQNDVPLAPLYGALLSASLANLGDQERVQKLNEAALAYRETQDKLKVLASTDPVVAKLRAEAETKLGLGAFDEARAMLAQAAGVDAGSGAVLSGNLVERRISEAQTHTADAGVALTQLDYAGAIVALERAAALHSLIEQEKVPDETRRERDWLLAHLGDLYLLQGDTRRALGAYERMQDAATIRWTVDTENFDAKRDFGASQNRIGDVKMMQGDRAGALAAYENGLEASTHLASKFPDDMDSHSDLAISHDRIGDIRFAEGDLRGALEAFEAAGDIRARLAALEPQDRTWRRDLSVSLTKIGTVKMAQRDLPGALDVYQQGLDIAAALAAEAPGNAGLQRDLSVSQSRLGNVRMEQGDLAGALAAYQSSLDIAIELADRDKGNADLQRDLSISFSKIGNVKMAQGDRAGARAAYLADLDITERLAAQDESNSEWQRDLVISHYKVAQAGADRRQHLTSALEIAQRMDQRGVLAPGDRWLLKALRKELAKRGAAAQ